MECKIKNKLLYGVTAEIIHLA